MDFSTALGVPVRVTIDGTPYEVPRFLLPQFKAWVAERQKKSVDAAMQQLGEDQEARARFCLYWQPAPIDVAALIEDATTPEGIEYVLSTCLKSAGLPDDKRAALFAAGDPGKLRALARLLLNAENTAGVMKSSSEDPGVRGNPTTGQPPTSGGSPTTTAETAPYTSEASQATTPTA